MNVIFVTIAIPFYNSENYLSFAIQSVINQTYKNWELLLIDDGSNDKSLQIARDFASRDSRIKVYCDGKNKKLAARLNESVKLAKGEYYARMDDDDIMTIDRIEKQVDFLYNHPEIDVVGSSSIHINSLNRIVGSQDMTGVSSSFIHPSIMGRTKWFLKNQYAEDLPRLQDLDLWLRTSSHSAFYNLSEPLLFYRNIGVPVVARYGRSMRSLRMIADRYKLYEKSIIWSFKMKIEAYIKQWVYYIFDVFDKTDILVSNRRVRTINDSLMLNNNDVSKSINSHML